MTRIRTMHPHGFRCGEWATLVGTASLPVPGYFVDRACYFVDRACYFVEFDDGVTDFWAVDDPDGRYEFAGGESDRPRS